MKKTITKPDGSTEVIEGTAEEIAEYERKNAGVVKENASKKQILTDDIKHDVVQLKELLDEHLRNHPKEEHHYHYRFTKTYPDWTIDWCGGKRPPCNPDCYACNGRPWFAVIPPPCICNNGWCTQPTYQPMYTLTVNTAQSSQDFKLVDEYQQSGGVLSVQTLANSKPLGVA